MSWWAAFLTSLGFGTLAAVLPIFNNEVYVVAAMARSWSGIVPLALGLGLGNTVGKTAVFLAWRHGKRLAFTKQRSKQRAYRRWISVLLEWVSHPIAGPAVVLLACIFSIPPLYPTTLVAATSKMRWSWFTVAVLVGETTRMALLAAGTAGLLALF